MSLAGNVLCVAVTELKSSHYIGKTLLFDICIYTHPLWQFELSSVTATLSPKRLTLVVVSIWFSIIPIQNSI